jgi:hypothetical protein
MDAIEDTNHYLWPTFGLQGEALQAAREQVVERCRSIDIAEEH